MKGWRRPIAPLLVLALGLALYVPALGREILRHPLEAKYALASREMLRGGPLLVAHLFGEPYPDKPPLYFWTVAGLGWLNGGRITEITARLPAVAAALAGLFLVYRLGADLFGPRAGFLSAISLATTNLFFWYARQGHPDQLLTAFVALACLGLWRALARSPQPAGGWTALAYSAMALGVMSKGLLGLVLPLLAVGAYLATTESARTVPRRLGLWPGLAVFLVVVLGWYGPAVARYGAGYAYETIIHQHVVRYTHTWVHAGPWYYYLGEFASEYFPWLLFLPSAVILGWRAGGQPFRFPLAWFVSGFVFFSLSTGKRGAYLLPLYPAAALMVGWLWDRALDSRTPTRWVGVPLTLLSGTVAALGVALVVVPRRLIPGRMVDTMVPTDRWHLAAAIVLLLAGAAAVWIPWRQGRPAAALAALVVVQAGLLLAVAVIRAPQYEARFPVRELTARVRGAVPPGLPLLSLLDDYNFIVAFYLDRPITPLPGPSELLAARPADQPRYALVGGGDAEVLRQPGVETLAEGRLGPKRVLAVRLDPTSR